MIKKPSFYHAYNKIKIKTSICCFSVLLSEEKRGHSNMKIGRKISHIIQIGLMKFYI